MVLCYYLPTSWKIACLLRGELTSSARCLHRGLKGTTRSMTNKFDFIVAATKIIEGAPKSVRWEARAANGARAQWCTDVEEVDRADHRADHRADL